VLFIYQPPGYFSDLEVIWRVVKKFNYLAIFLPAALPVLALSFSKGRLAEGSEIEGRLVVGGQRGIH
jgi:hypothetical protein